MAILPTQEQLDKAQQNDEALGLPVGTTARQIAQESGWDANAVSSAGARGFAQVMPDTLASVESQVGRPLDPANYDDALLIQRTVMGQNLNKFGNIPDALRAYNAGWDQSKWDNPETNGYVQTILGGVISKPSKFQQGAAFGNDATAAFQQQIQGTQADRGFLDEFMNPNDLSLERTAGQESADVAAQQSQMASPLESFEQSFGWGTVFGGFQDLLANDPAPRDPNFWSKDRVDSLSANYPDIWNNQDLKEYVQGAQSEPEARRRIERAKERADFLRRYSNADGMLGFEDGLETFAAPMVDPVSLLVGMGTGATFNIARASMASKAVESASALSAVGSAAATNMILDASVRTLNHQSVGWDELLQQGLAGAAFGALGHMLTARNLPGMDDHAPLLDGGIGAADGVIENTVQRAPGARITSSPGYVGSGLDEWQSALSSPAHAAMDSGPAYVAALEAERQQLRATQLDPLSGETVGRLQDRLTALRENAPSESDIKPLTRQLQAEERMKFKQAQAEATKRVNKQIEEHQAKVEKAEQALADNERANKTSSRLAEIENELADLKPKAGPTGPGNLSPLTEQLKQAFKASGDEHIQAVRTEESSIPATKPLPGDRSGVAALRQIADSSSDPMVKALAGRLADQLKGDVELVRKPDTTAEGEFDSKVNRITVGGAAGEPVLLHEAAHAATEQKINYGLKNPESTHGKLVSELDAIRQTAQAAYKGADKATQYHLSSLHEFVAGLYGGNKDFIQHLMSMKANTGSLLSRAVDLVRSLLGIPESQSNAFLEALRLSDNLIDQPLGQVSDGVYHSAPIRDEGFVGPAAQDWQDVIRNFDESPQSPEITKQRERSRKWTEATFQGMPGMATFHRIADTVGEVLGHSKSKAVRVLAGLIGEDASGHNRISGTTAAMEKVRLADSFKFPFMEIHDRVLAGLLNWKEKAEFALGGGQERYQQISDLVAEERLKHRAAVQAGQQYTSTAHPLIRELASALDGFWRTVSEVGTQAGDPISEGIKGMGYVGHMPYRWDWKALHNVFNNDIPKYNAFKENMRQQYMRKVIDPAIQKLLDAGPVHPQAVADLRAELAPKVESLVDNYIKRVMTDPKSRITDDTNHFSAIAEQLLHQDWHGATVTHDMADEFGKRLSEIIQDRSRTEFDMLSEVNGTRLLDFMSTDISHMVEGGSNAAAGRIALHKFNLGTPAQISGAMEAARRDGATPKELDDLDFLIRSISGNLSNKEHAVVKLLKQGTYASMMGKLGINAAADLLASVASVGPSGFVKMIGSGIGNLATKGNRGLISFLNEHAGSAMGLDYRFHFSETPESRISPESFLAQGSTFRRLAGNAVNAVTWLSPLRLVARMQHNVVAPYLADEIFDTIKTGSGITPQRLADMGILPRDVPRIKAQIMRHDATRQRGGWINMDKWDDQYAADVFIDSVHRAVSQVLQRANVGETPRWTTESQIGQFVAQFHNFGITAAAKQLNRNVFIGDTNAAVAFTAATAWGAMLYYAKIQSNALNMDAMKRDEYLKENLSGVRLAQGIAIMVNMSGLLPDIMDFGSLVFGGQNYSGSGPVAMMGYVANIGKAASAAGQIAYGAATGHKPGSLDPVDYHKRLRDMWRIMPGANTLMGTALSNSLNSDSM